MPSLDVAIKIAKENDIIFLEPGTYKGTTPKYNLEVHLLIFNLFVAKLIEPIFILERIKPS